MIRWSVSLRLLAVVWVVAAGVPAGAARSTQSMPTAERVASALDLYARGSHAEGLKALRGRQSLRDTVRDFDAHAVRWMNQDPILRPVRKATALAVTVELVSIGVAGTAREYAAAYPLIEGMCATIRKEPPSDAERLFHLATIGLLQGASDLTGLVGFGSERGGGASGHLSHAAERFPWEPRLKLASLLTRRELGVIGTRPLDRLMPFTAAAPGVGREAAIADTVARLTALAKEPAIEHEAMLRRGVLRFMDGEPDAAPDFQHAALSDEPFVRYLAELMLGVTYERSADTQSAIGAYSRAVRAMPATAASMALASLLFREGRPDEAAQAANDWSRRSNVQDPWRLFEYGDYRLVPDVLRVLRNAR